MRSTLGRAAALVYGILCYAAFVVAFLYAVGFVTGIGVPRTVDRGIESPLTEAVLVNLMLLGAFAVPHSVMARPGFKKRWTRIVPPAIERSTYVLVSSALLGLLFWQWRTMDVTVWHIEPPAARAVIWVIAAAGWATVVTSTFMLSHVELFGLRQVFDTWRSGKPDDANHFRTPMLYRLVRHPLMLGFVVAFWAAPTMTAGHLLFAAASTAYILVALRFEERDLIATLGDQYRRYRGDVPMLIPRPAQALRRIPRLSSNSRSDSLSPPQIP
ncbi:methanethiol S-methyltransferase [Mycobacterium sp. SMC-4]|uniref:methanethiol S-methyltransferase n=1 Tax=Mycobacterium sp. SMC-4 TaxID=2857059 RepID=UPI003CFE892E